MDNKDLISRLQDRMLLYSKEQILDILRTYQYEKKIEILPDLIINNLYYYYDYDIGEYIVAFELPIRPEGIVIVRGIKIVMGYETFYKLNENVIDGELNRIRNMERDITRTNEQRKVKVLENCMDEIYELGENKAYILDFVKYKDNYILFYDYKHKYLVLIELVDGKLIFRNTFSLSSGPNRIAIGCDDVVVLSDLLYMLKSGKLVPIEIENKNLRYGSLGEHNNIFAYDTITEISYLYNAKTNTFKRLKGRIAGKITIITDSLILIGGIIYRYMDDDLKPISNIGMFYEPHNISILTKYNDPYTEIYKMLLDGKTVIKSFITKVKSVRDIFVIPLSKSSLRILYKDYRWLIPMVNSNVKNLILNFCRGDELL